MTEDTNTALAPLAQGHTTLHVHMLEVIERASRDKDVDIDKFERLLAMRDKVAAQAARDAYFAALAVMQPRLPIINEHGRLVVREKETRRITQSTPYAQWEDIVEAITPVISEYGFALWFRTGTAADGKLTVTCILSHRNGHAEETTIALPHDSTGSKNAVQAIGSTTSYGKRYTAGALLNIVSRAPEDADTDGAAGAAEKISAEQVERIQKLIVEAGADISRFLDYARRSDATVTKIDDIKTQNYAKLVEILDKKKGSPA